MKNDATINIGYRIRLSLWDSIKMRIAGARIGPAPLVSKKIILQMIADTRAMYSESIFSAPKAGSSVDCYSAAGARLACEIMYRRIDRGEWGE